MTTTKTAQLFSMLALSVSLVACADDAAPQPDLLALPGQAFFPESLTASDDGTIYVGSLTTGQVVAYADGETAPRAAIANPDVLGQAGVLVHGDTLWMCAIDATFQKPTELRSFSLDGTAKAQHVLPPSQFCNDIAIDHAGAVYATDSFSGNVLRLSPGADAPEVWLQDARFTPASQGAFGLDGIAAVNGALYVSTLDTGRLFRVDLESRAITEITVTPALVAPDGIRALDDHTLLVVEQAGRLTRVEISGSTAKATALASDLDQPTSVVVTRGSAWVTEGQIGKLLAGENPALPFAVRRIDL